MPHFVENVPYCNNPTLTLTVRWPLRGRSTDDTRNMPAKKSVVVVRRRVPLLLICKQNIT